MTSLGSPSIQLALKYMTVPSSTTLMSMLTAYFSSSDCFAIRYFTRVGPPRLRARSSTLTFNSSVSTSKRSSVSSRSTRTTVWLFRGCAEEGNGAPLCLDELLRTPFLGSWVHKPRICFAFIAGSSVVGYDGGRSASNGEHRMNAEPVSYVGKRTEGPGSE